MVLYCTTDFRGVDIRQNRKRYCFFGRLSWAILEPDEYCTEILGIGSMDGDLIIKVNQNKWCIEM